MTTFNTVKHIGEKSVIASLEDNIKSFLDWGFLNIGGFVNASIPPVTSNPATILKPVSYPPKPPNTVWETTRKDWVYETGISYSNSQPINISGIYVNSNFAPLTIVSNDIIGLSNPLYSINYPLGQVIFSSSQSSNSSIRLNYSYRYVQVYKSNESVWWKEIQKLAYNTHKAADGDKKLFADHKVQMPAIIIETIPRMSQTPYQLGSVKNIITQDVLLHIFAESPTERANLVDVLILQKDKDSFLYDINKLVKNNKQPLNFDGSKNQSGFNYGQILSNAQYLKNAFYIENAVLSEYNQISSSLYNAVIRWTLKIYP
jgi:hypothetical protein